MAIFMVTNTTDSSAGSLRWAIESANLAAGADTIRFSENFDGEESDIIRLTSGQIEIADTLTLIGGARGVTITGDAGGDDVTLADGTTDVASSEPSRLDDNSRIFDVTKGNLTVEGLTLTGGSSKGEDEDGGAIRAAGNLTLIQTSVSGNSTAGENSSGGGLYGAGSITLRNSTVSENFTNITGDTYYDTRGGGIYGQGIITLIDSKIAGNAADASSFSSGQGGGIFGLSDVVLRNTEVTDNRVWGYLGANGAGVFSSGAIMATDSTVEGNQSAAVYVPVGAGLSGKSIQVERSLIANNSTSGSYAEGAGVRGQQVTVVDSIVTGNEGGGVAGSGEASRVAVTGSTISNNTGSSGAGVSGGTVDIVSSYIVKNNALGALDRRSGDPAKGGGVSGNEVTIADSVIKGNSAHHNGFYGAYGGGVHGQNITITGSSVVENHLEGSGTQWGQEGGGGVAGKHVSISNSTIAGNDTTGDYAAGGGVHATSVSLTNATIFGNSTAGQDASGGGIWSSARVTAISSTISGNSTAGYRANGGGIFSDERISLTNSIVLGNAATYTGQYSDSGDVLVEPAKGDELFSEKNRIDRTGGNIIGDEAGGALVLSGSTRIGTTTASEVFADTTTIAGGVVAGRLADNGGPVETIALRPGEHNPAIGLAVPGGVSTDARGVERDNMPDVGAFEFQQLVFIGSDDPDALEGNEADNVIMGGRGADSLYGFGGDDELWGQGGTDFLDGGEGFDLVDYSENHTSVHVDLSEQLVSFPNRSWNDENMVSIEAARTGSGRDILDGDNGANLLFGGRGKDVLRGGAGDDSLEGGGNTDSISGGHGHDIILYADTPTDVTVNLKAQKASFPDKDWKAERFKSIEGAITGIGDDRLVGDRKANTFWGGDGDDLFVAGKGADTLYGGAGYDTFKFKQTSHSRGNETDKLLSGDGAPAFDAPGDQTGDTIDLGGIDADTTKSGNQSFKFGTDEGKSHLWLSEEDGVTYVYGNVDGDKKIDFSLAIADGQTSYLDYSEQDFIL